MPYLNKPKKQATRSIPKEDRQKVYKNPEWLKIREAKLMESPLCELCQKDGLITPATQVHHIISPFEKGLFYAYNFNNLLSICEKCHGLIHSTHKEESLHHIYFERCDGQNKDEEPSEG